MPYMPADPATGADTHLRSRFPFMELGGVLRARRAPATGGEEAAQGATGTRTWPRGGVATVPSRRTAAKALLGREAARD